MLDTCELIFKAPTVAQSKSSAISSGQGVRFRLAVVGHAPYKVFWSTTEQGPRIEAVFPHP